MQLKQTPKFCRDEFESIFVSKISTADIFYKIHAHKWLYTAFCGYNIFLVTLSWHSRIDDINRLGIELVQKNTASLS